MPDFDNNLDKEIEEGLARSEKMLRNQRLFWPISIFIAIIIFLFCCCSLGGLYWLWQNGDSLFGLSILIFSSLG